MDFHWIGLFGCVARGEFIPSMMRSQFMAIVLLPTADSRHNPNPGQYTPTRPYLARPLLQWRQCLGCFLNCLCLWGWGWQEKAISRWRRAISRGEWVATTSATCHLLHDDESTEHPIYAHFFVVEKVWLNWGCLSCTWWWMVKIEGANEW